jgi:imidazolonepropionase-like amidohydrolase
VARELEDALRSGIATLLLLPGNETVFGGRGVVVKPVGLSVEDMVRIGEKGLKMSVAPRSGRTRMEQMARLRSALDGARRKIQELEEENGQRRGRRRKASREALPWEKPGEGPEPGVDPRQRILVELLEGEIRAFVWCETAGDVAAAYRLADAYGYEMVPVLGPGTWRAASLLAERQATPVLDPELVVWERTPEGEVEAHALPAELLAAGVPFALTTEPTALAAQYPLYQAAVAVRWGVPREEALAAVTRIPAELAGMGDTLGTLEPGREATMLLLSGDPLASATWVERVWIAGEEVYNRAGDAKLERLLGDDEEEAEEEEDDDDDEDEDDHEHDEDDDDEEEGNAR